MRWKKSLQRTADPRQRLRKILSTLWREIHRPTTVSPTT
jgi:hypothetical protein